MRVAFVLCAVTLGLGHSAEALLSCGEQEINTYVTGVQANPALARDPAGGFVVTWTSEGSDDSDSDDRCIRMRAFDDAAVARGADFQVNSHTPGRQRRAAAAVDPTSGHVLVVWESASSAGSDTLSGSIQGRLYDVAGTPLGGQTQVNSHTTGAQRNPRVAASDAGGFVVVWDSASSPGDDGDSFGIVGRRVDGAGVPLGTDFQINSHTTSYQVRPTLAAGGGGGFVVVWASNGSPADDGSSTAIVGRRLASDATPVGSDFQVNAYTTGFQDYPRVAATNAGGFVVAWRSDGSAGTDTDYESVQARRFDAAAAPLGAQFQVNTYTTGSQGDPDVGGDGRGGFVVVWESEGSAANDGDGWSIQARHYDGAGLALDDQVELNTHAIGDQQRPRIASDGLGGLLVVWESSVGSALDGAGSIQLQRVHETSCSTTSTTTSSSSSSTTTPTAPSTSSTSSSSSSTTTPTGPSTSSTSSSSSSTTTPTGPSTSSTTTSSTSPPSTSTTSTTIAAHPISGRRLRVDESRRGGRRPGRALLLSRDQSLGIEPPVPDPQLSDGEVRITSLANAFDERVTLSPAGWTRVRRGYRYRADDGVRIVLKPGKRLTARLRGPDFRLGDVPPTPIVVTLRIGSLRFCVEFTEASVNVKRRRLVATNSPPPATCQDPPRP